MRCLISLAILLTTAPALAGHRVSLDGGGVVLSTGARAGFVSGAALHWSYERPGVVPEMGVFVSRRIFDNDPPDYYWDFVSLEAAALALFGEGGWMRPYLGAGLGLSYTNLWAYDGGGPHLLLVGGLRLELMGDLHVKVEARPLATIYRPGSGCVDACDVHTGVGVGLLAGLEY